MRYHDDTDPSVPVEVRIRMATRDLVLCAWVTDHGTIGYTLSTAASGTSQSLSNLQSRATYPRKAVRGWQLEVIEFAKAGLGEIAEVR